MKALIVGLGMGYLYFKILRDKGASVITVDVDASKTADFTDLTQCLNSQKEPFDISIICTPNHTHYSIAQQIAPHTNILMVDKPGCKTADEWQNLIESNPKTRIMMIKNNMWRHDSGNFQSNAKVSNKIVLCWINQNRVPRPGSWFTDRDRAYSGVSRDLMPHLLSIYACMEPQHFSTCRPNDVRWTQRWQLSDLADSDYGQVDTSGVYNVDDVIEFKMHQVNDHTQEIKEYYLVSNWRSNHQEDIGCHYYSDDSEIHTTLGLCPEEAYSNMIEQALENYENLSWWEHQYRVDHWIHRTIDYITRDEFKVE
jgi:predicted dehydrogenase